MRIAHDGGTLQRGIGGDHGIKSVATNCRSNRLNLYVIQIWCNLQRQRDIVAVLVGESLLLVFEASKQRLQGVVLLQ